VKISNISRYKQILAYSNELVFSSGGEVLAVRAKADTPNIQVTRLVHAFVLQAHDLSTSGHIKDLRRMVATCSNVAAVLTESHATYNTIVLQIVDEFDVQRSWYTRVKNGEPLICFPLLAWRKLVWVQVCELVSNIWNSGWRWRWRRSRRLRRSRIRCVGRLLGCRRSRPA